MNFCKVSTKLNDTFKLQTKLLLNMKLSQPQQSIFFRPIYILANFTVSLFITAVLQTEVLHSNLNLFHSHHFSLRYHFFLFWILCVITFFLQFWDNPRQWDSWSKCYIINFYPKVFGNFLNAQEKEKKIFNLYTQSTSYISLFHTTSLL